MPLPSFAALGIDDVAVTVYRHVVAGGGPADEDSAAAGPTAAAVARAVRLDEATALAALERLRSLGLVQRTAGGEGYGAVDPRVAVPAVVAARADELVEVRAAVPELGELFDEGRRPHDADQLTRVVVGHAAVGDWYSRLEHRATTDFVAFDRPPYVVASNESTQRVALGRGVRWRAVYTVASISVDGSWQGVHRLGADGEEARITHDLPVKLAIADRRVALVSIGHDPERPEALVTESEPLVAALYDLFEARWRGASPVPGTPGVGRAAVDWASVAARLAAASASGATRTRGGAVPSRDEEARPATRPPTPAERDLLALVAAGATDDVIAGQLGISSRTLRRRLHALFDELGASNRFHAGVEAARRGWV
ncbi:helix-turn-helix transcriptional regulator [Frigoribacterium sp. PhB24]|uniref:helix-turn-helix transcriptional regulator n=1 Tax=Frigoribacterium sp. PhB24 TaxID=2485204 RepID=UPI000FAE33B3|nr:helix-turn-helix transcriptional regulator [Frigoribacterium sp. PhB24]ROS52715.1 regulatory LuxR family protein [Frigoribacterium sp. PhB24]